MRRRAVIIGMVAGLLLGGLIGALRGPLAPQAPPPLPEDGGRITRVVMQYHPDAAPLVVPIYRQFLRALGPRAEVVWAVGQAPHADHLRARLGDAWPRQSRTVVIGKDVTTWSKDRFVALGEPGQRAAAILCAPARRRTPNPLRTNDQEVAYRLAQDAEHIFHVRETDLAFDGGDVLATARHLFAGPAILEKNAPQSASEVTRALERALCRKVVWLGGPARTAPAHHVGMFLTVMGDTAAVGDVRLAEAVLQTHPEMHAALRPAGGVASPTVRADLQRRLDAVAAQMQALGYTVVRLPLLPAAAEKAWMSYNNGIVETRGGETVFYMPTFGAPPLDTAAAEIFRTRLHCTVVPIDCARVWPLGGSLHCLVNVVAREE